MYYTRVDGNCGAFLSVCVISTMICPMVASSSTCSQSGEETKERSRGPRQRDVTNIGNSPRWFSMLGGIINSSLQAALDVDNHQGVVEARNAEF